MDSDYQLIELVGDEESSHRPRRWLRALVACALVGVLLCGAIYYALVMQPALGAQAADTLRGVIGQDAVAQLETTVYNTQDQFNQWLAGVGLKQAQAPWADTASVDESTNSAEKVPPAAPKPAVTLRHNPLPAAVATAQAAMHIPDTVPSTTASANAAVNQWKPPAVAPFSALSEEGEWLPYIRDSNGRAVAYRTFVVPDHERRYVVVGIVAFDLRATQLHFVLGTEEPKSSEIVARTGRIPAADAQAGKLLAVFNGGFKTEHGQFGVMAEHKILLAPLKTNMTVAQEADGTIQMGVWGDQDVGTASLNWWRQNGLPIIHHGQINPATNDLSVRAWGASIDGAVAVWRSALGLSRDGRVLYYAAGDGVVMPAMARALQAAGVYNAMQLDINNYWVSFSAVTQVADKLVAEPLFDKMKASSPDRYLKAYSRDYFYVTMR